MRHLLILIGVVCLAFILLPCCAPAPEQQAEPVGEEAPTTEADVEAIHGVLQRFDDTTNAGDAENWLTLITDDVLWMVPNQSTLTGKEAVRGRVQPFFDELDMEHVTTVLEVEVAAEWAFARGNYKFRVIPKTGGETSEEIGKFIHILERQSDGSWKITRAIWNQNVPPPE